MKKLYVSLLALFLFLPSLGLSQQVDNTVSVWDKASYGVTPGISYVLLNGNNPAITTTFEPLWPQSGAYTVRAVAMTTPYCASESAADDAASTGARSIRVTGVNTSYAAFSEDLVTDGQTSVTLVTTNILFFNSVTVLTTGSGGTNAGIIRCGTGTNTAGVPAVTDAYVGASFGQSQSAMYLVPANKKLLCRNWQAGSYGVTAAQTVQFAINTYPDPVNSVTLLTRREYLGFINQAGASSLVNPYLRTFPEKTAVIVQALSAASTGPVQVSAECLLIDSALVNTNQIYF